MSEPTNIIDVTEDNFEIDVLERSHELPVVVDFWAPWCGPCRMLGPILERLAEDNNYNFVLAKLNVDDSPNISMQYQVQGIPAVKAFLNGQVVSEFVGALPEPKVIDFIQKVTPSESDIAFGEANSLLNTRHWLEAEEALREVLDEYPNHPGARLSLAKALLATGQGCEAIELLNLITDGNMFMEARDLLPLAAFLCRAETSPDELNGDPIETQYIQAGRLIQFGNLEAALDGLIGVLRYDKRFREGEAKRAILGIFVLLGEEDPLTQTYRRELASVLF